MFRQQMLLLRTENSPLEVVVLRLIIVLGLIINSYVLFQPVSLFKNTL